MAHVDYLEEAISLVSEEIEARLVPFAEPLTNLDTVPGINKRTAEVLIAELGVDMSFFPSDRHLASWAALCPGNNESAGKHKSGKTRKGNPEPVNERMRQSVAEFSVGAPPRSLGAWVG